MKKVLIILAALAVLTFASCGTTMMDYPNEVKTSSLSYSKSRLTDEDTELPQSENAVPFDRKVIKQGTIRFETADVQETKSLIAQTVQELNGYISKDTVSDYSGRVEHTLIIRVPADKFDLLLQNISDSVDKLESKNIEVLDVTEEYIDVQSRVKTKKELQARYTELLKQAAAIDEMLNIEREIGKLQTEIESTEGRMRYLDDRTAFSTLTVTYYLPILSEPLRVSFFSEFKNGITTGWVYFLWFIIALSYLWVFIVIGIAVIVAVCILVRQEKKKPKGS